MTAPIAFVDTETTGLDPDVHEVWEVALILRTPTDDGRHEDVEHTWQLAVDLGRAEAKALEIGRFYERRQTRAQGLAHPADVAMEFAQLTAGCHLVGAVPSFDDAFLKRLLRANGACPGWHYHLIDVEALAVGYLARHRGVAAGENFDPQPPWNSSDLTAALRLTIDETTKHTALGDARWARAIYDAVMRP